MQKSDLILYALEAVIAIIVLIKAVATAIRYLRARKGVGGSRQ